MSHDQVHTQSSNLSKIPDVEPQENITDSTSNCI